MLKKLIEALIMPPLALFVLGGVGVLLRKRRPRLSKWMISLAVATLLLLCMPLVAAALLRSLQTAPALESTAGSGAQAIVVFLADFRADGVEFGGDSVGPLTLERLRYAAHLARETGLPILTSGGVPRRGARALAQLARDVLENDFRAPVRWMETRSANTLQNARFSAEMLAAEGVGAAYLVTHAWHMPRSLDACARTDLIVIPAPTGFRAWPALDLDAFLPSARSLRESTWALHEWIGRLWYALATT
jgi:uncharacterized SAM-binding protein YcdF (DUF218 family)